MGEIKDGLMMYAHNYGIAKRSDDFTFKDITHMCESLSKNSCSLYGLKCPMYREHIGCLFRQGKTPKEW